MHSERSEIAVSRHSKKMLMEKFWMSLKMKLSKIVVLMFCSALFWGCSNRTVKIRILPDPHNDFLCNLLNLYAEKYDGETGTLLISEENLVSLELQLSTFIKTNVFNIKNYYECKESGKNYLYTSFEFSDGELRLVQQESFHLVWDPENPAAIKTGKEIGYVKEPWLNIAHEISLFESNRSYYKTFGAALMKNNKRFFIDLEKYNFQIESYL